MFQSIEGHTPETLYVETHMLNASRTQAHSPVQSACVASRNLSGKQSADVPEALYIVCFNRLAWTAI